MTARYRQGPDVTTQAFLFLVLLTIANTVFNAAAMSLGWSFPYTSFLFRADDAFGDFFKFVLSYPGGKSIQPSRLLGLHDLITRYTVSTDYHGLEGLGQPGVEHLHVTPLATLLSLVSLRIMRWLDPVLLFLALIGTMIAYWVHITTRFVTSRDEALATIGISLIAYPSLMMIDRANLFAGAAALLIVHAMLLARGRQAPVGSAIFLAIAINIRPNAIIFAVPLLAFHWKARWRAVANLTVMGATIFGAALTASTALYPDYRWTTFLMGLHAYYEVYVVGDLGLNYGSSLYGALKLLLGFRPMLGTAASAIAGMIMALAMLAWTKRRIDEAALLFLTCAAYALGSAVLGDYHLMVFLILPIAIAQAAGKPPRLNAADKTILIASILILGPKNYAFVGETSWQVVLNPLIMLTASMVLLWRTISRPRHAVICRHDASIRSDPEPYLRSALP